MRKVIIASDMLIDISDEIGECVLHLPPSANLITITPSLGWFELGEGRLKNQSRIKH